MDRTPYRPHPRDPRSLGARLIGFVAGAWLFASAFLWPHTEAQRGNCFIVGLVIATIAVLGDHAPQMRFVHAVAAVWLFVSSFALTTLMHLTFVNDVAIAILVFAASMIDYAPRSPLGQAGA
ncbi:MAG: hypothetical protein H5U40_00405 [Polyangiaceae bacterium]|nr:hypothetical protein [Polyangiaceae bacterium]